jgi:hypothetical protein
MLCQHIALVATAVGHFRSKSRQDHQLLSLEYFLDAYFEAWHMRVPQKLARTFSVRNWAAM